MMQSSLSFAKSFAIAGSIMTIIFLAIINFLTSSHYPWFLFPSIVIIWWPLSVCLARRNTMKSYSTLSALLMISFLAITNYINTPTYPWVLYTIVPIILWPLCIFLGKKAISPSIALFGSALSILYYCLLNIYLSPSFPWAIFPAYVLLWWPLSAIQFKYNRIMLFSVLGTILTCAFFTTLNIITTSNNIWAIYPIFAILWWPLSIYFFHYKH